MRWTILVLLVAGGCAVTARTCPVGTKLIGARPPNGYAQGCRSIETLVQAMPTPGRGYETSLGVARPTAIAGGLRGPYTTWHPNGKLASHGHYLDFGARSVPDGVWAFWDERGAPRTLGRYRRGEPAGCFATWDEAGTRRTGFVDGTDLRVAPCEPPALDELADLDGAGDASLSAPAWGDIGLQGFVGAGGIGARNAGQVDRDPALAAAFNATVRKQLGPLRVEPTVAIRTADTTEYLGLAAGGVIAMTLPSLHPRLDADVGIELGVQHLRATAIRPAQPGVGRVGFWSPLGAAQLQLALALSPTLAAVVAARVDGAPRRDVARDVTYCDRGCFAPVRETWEVGGFTAGATLGLRLVIR